MFITNKPAMISKYAFYFFFRQMTKHKILIYKITLKYLYFINFTEMSIIHSQHSSRIIYIQPNLTTRTNGSLWLMLVQFSYASDLAESCASG